MPEAKLAPEARFAADASGPSANRPVPGPRRRFRRSLMAKLLLILVATGVLVNIIVSGFHKMHFGGRSRAALEANVEHYARLLAREIGSPPDTAAARSLASRYSLHIRYWHPAGESAARGGAPAWESGPKAEFPRKGRGPGLWSREIRTDPLPAPGAQGASSGAPAGSGALAATPSEPERLGWYRGRFFVEVNHGQGRYLFATDFRQMMDGMGGYLFLLIGILSLVLAGAFFAIRRLLYPLKGLTAAVERMGRGELGHQVAYCTRDELGELASSFNSMSTGLKEMVRSREQLLLDVSHELRSPLTRIRVALEMAPDGTDKESIGDDLREMESMIAEILETARLDSAHGRLNMERVDLGALVAEAVAEADGRAPGAKLVSAPPRGGPWIKADRARLRKVLANVLDNAAKFSQAGEAPVEVRISEGVSEVTVLITDKGVGIPSEEIPRLFEPFYRVDRSRSRDTGGYGLGLSLCKRIMEAHGGTIAIRSGAGEGTEVSLVLPKA